jgi:hypothetical protein
MSAPGLAMSRRQVLGLLAAGAVGAACGGNAAPKAQNQAATAPTPAQETAPAPAIAPLGQPPPAAVGGKPNFSNVAEVGPNDIALYFAGRLPNYPGVSVANFLGYSPADILESMDTAVLDQIGQGYGQAAVDTIHTIVARNLLESLLAIYGSQPLLLGLDAGHGGLASVYFEPGSNGTEWQHTRAVVGIVEEMAADARYTSVTIRRIFNDAIGDDFGLPPPQDSKARASLVIRNARASMLAYEANAWNHAHPDGQVAFHVLSVHFNANSGGTLVLHEGDDVPADLMQRSMAYGRDYVDRARPALNATGVISPQLGLVNGNGLHDDSLMYAPPIRAGASRVNPLTGNALHGPPRYAMLQASLLEQDYVQGLLNYRRLA